MATWNVQGYRGKMQEIIKEMEQLRSDIASITETKKKGSGTELIGNYLHFYSGVPKESRGKRVSLLIHKKWTHNITNWQCSDERIITVNINILKTRFTIIGVHGPNEDEPVTNKHLFYETFLKVVKDFGNNRKLVLVGDFKARSDNGARLIDLCEQNNLKITNGFFQHKEIYKFT